jgi:hypothetical protein
MLTSFNRKRSINKEFLSYHKIQSEEVANNLNKNNPGTIR